MNKIISLILIISGLFFGILSALGLFDSIAGSILSIGFVFFGCEYSEDDD